MSASRIPTVDQVFGTLNDVCKLLLKQPSVPPDERRTSFGARLGHEPPGLLTTVDLRGETLERYRELLSKLWAATYWGRRGGYDDLCKLAQRFILEIAVDAGPGRAEIQRRYAQLLRSKIKEEMRPWRIIVQVPARLQGVDNVRLAGLRFRSMTDEQKRTLQLQIARVVRRPHRSRISPLMGFQDLIGLDVTCTVDVEAPDAALAFVVAQELIDERLDCLAGVLALTREAKDPRNDPLRRGGPRLAIDLKKGQASAQFLGINANDVELSTLAESRSEPQLKRLLRMIARSPRHSGERRLLDAIRWLGRSHRAPTEIMAYTFAAIAYETILKTNARRDISYWLRLRCAQLLGTNRDSRRRLLHAKLVKELYDKRSTVVHANDHRVDLDELVNLWALLNHVVLAYMERGFHRKSEEDIERWFEDQTL